MSTDSQLRKFRLLGTYVENGFNQKRKAKKNLILSNSLNIIRKRVILVKIHKFSVNFEIEYIFKILF